jgi:cytochrome P450
VTTSVIDLTSVEFRANPYPFFRQLREAGAPFWFPHGGPTGGMWMITRYTDVVTLLKEANTSKDSSRITPPEQRTAADFDMLSKDPPDHTRLRALASQAFTPNRIRALEGRITAIVDELLDRVQARGEMDFIADFALPLPVTVIAELLGVPHEDQDMFHAWSTELIRGMDALSQSAERRRQSEEAALALVGYFTDLIARRREQPRDDLISALIQARDAQDRLSEDELLATCRLLLVAGHETTVNLLGNGLLTLLRHPDQLALLKARPELLPSAIEEMLRFESPVQRATFRLTNEPVTLSNGTIETGQQVSAVIAAANRDPDQFPDPDTFDIARQPNRHVAFGLGIHFCLGAPLARAEARIGFARLLERLPNLQLAGDTADWLPDTFFRGLCTLPVTF